MLRGFLLVDFWLVSRVFTPLSQWVDWRFHHSPYQQAYRVLQVAQFMQLGGAVLVAIDIGWFGLLSVAVCALQYVSFRDWYTRLEKCQRQFEKDPATFCFEQVWFMNWFSALPRLFFLIMGGAATACLESLAFATHGGYGTALINGGWLSVVAVGLYLAGCYPSQRPRKKKEEKAPLFAAPSPT